MWTGRLTYAALVPSSSLEDDGRQIPDGRKVCAAVKILSEGQQNERMQNNEVASYKVDSFPHRRMCLLFRARQMMTTHEEPIMRTHVIRTL